MDDDIPIDDPLGANRDAIELSDYASLKEAADEGQMDPLSPTTPTSLDKTAEGAKAQQSTMVRSGTSAQHMAPPEEVIPEVVPVSALPPGVFEALYNASSGLLEAGDMPRNNGIVESPMLARTRANISALEDANDPVIRGFRELGLLDQSQVEAVRQQTTQAASDPGFFSKGADGTFSSMQTVVLLDAALPENFSDPNGILDACRKQLSHGDVSEGGLAAKFSSIGEVLAAMDGAFKEDGDVRSQLETALENVSPAARAEFAEYMGTAVGSSMRNLHPAAIIDMSPNVPAGFAEKLFDNPLREYSDAQPEQVRASTFMANAQFLLSEFPGNFKELFSSDSQALSDFNEINQMVADHIAPNGQGLYELTDTGSRANDTIRLIFGEAASARLAEFRATLSQAVEELPEQSAEQAQAAAAAQQTQNVENAMAADGDVPKEAADDAVQTGEPVPELPGPGASADTDSPVEVAAAVRAQVIQAFVDGGLAVDKATGALQDLADGKITPKQFVDQIQAQVGTVKTTLMDANTPFGALLAEAGDLVGAFGKFADILRENAQGGGALADGIGATVDKVLPEGSMRDWLKDMLLRRWKQLMLGSGLLGVITEGVLLICDKIKHDKLKSACNEALGGSNKGNPSDCSGLPARSLPAEQKALEAMLAGIIATYYMYENRATLSPTKPPKWSLQGSYSVSRSMLQGGMLADLPDVLDTLLSNYVEVSETMQNQGMGEVLQELAQIPGLTFGPVAGGFAPPSWNVKIDTNNPSVSCYTDPGLGTVTYAVARNFNSCVCHRVIGTISVKNKQGAWSEVGEGTYRVPPQNSIVAVRWQMSQPVQIADIKAKNVSGWTFSPANLVISNKVTGATQFGKNMQMLCPKASDGSGLVIPTFTWTITELENYKEWFLAVTGDVLVRLPTTQVGVIHFQIANGAFLKPGAGDNGWRSMGPAPGLPKLIPPWLLSGKYALCALNGDKEPCSGPTLPTLALALGVVLLIGGYMYFKQKKGKK